MAYRVLAADQSDVTEMAELMIRAMKDDPFWTTIMGSVTHDQQVQVVIKNNLPRLGKGVELGVCQTWKVVDEDGNMAGWGGLGIPKPISAEEWESLQMKFEIPAGRNEKLYEFFMSRVLGSTVGRLDRSRDCQRQNTMVDPAHQRKGVGKLITEKCAEEADKLNAATWVRARPKAASLFLKEGYEVVERIDSDLADFGGEGKTSYFVMRRTPRAEKKPNARLEMTW